jgi:hypothetical protein
MLSWIRARHGALKGSHSTHFAPEISPETKLEGTFALYFHFFIGFVGVLQHHGSH